MAALLNRARMTTTTTGTGTVTLGSAVTGYASFAEAGAVNATVYSYCIEDGDDFEIGVGTYTSSGTTFSRDTVTLSKISGTSGTTKINLSGSAEIFITFRVGDADVTNAASVAAAGAVMDLQNPSGNDLNNAVDDGFYVIISSTTNTPGGTGPSGSACIVSTYNSANIKQIFISHTGKFMYVRRMVASVWGSWTQILETGDIGSVVQAYDAQLTAFAANTGITGTVTVSTSDPSGGSDGDIWLKYTA